MTHRDSFRICDFSSAEKRTVKSRIKRDYWFRIRHRVLSNREKGGSIECRYSLVSITANRMQWVTVQYATRRCAQSYGHGHVGVNLWNIALSLCGLQLILFTGVKNYPHPVSSFSARAFVYGVIQYGEKVYANENLIVFLLFTLIC